MNVGNSRKLLGVSGCVRVAIAFAFIHFTGLPRVAFAAQVETAHYSIDYLGITHQEVIEFGKKADKAYAIVKRFVGNLPKHEFIRVQQVKMVIRPEFRIPKTLISLWRGQNRMEMPVHRVRDGRAPLIHETTHSLSPSRNRFLAEGLAVYLEEKFGTLNAFPTFGRTVKTLLCGSIKQGNMVPLAKLFIETIDYYNIFSRAMVGTWTMRLAYLEGGALVKRLLNDKRFGPNPEARKISFFRLFNGEGDIQDIYQTKPGPLGQYLIRQTCPEIDRRK